MKSDNNHNSVVQLYREYQRERDSIPKETLDSLFSASDSLQHEESIDTILQLSKVQKIAEGMHVEDTSTGIIEKLRSFITTLQPAPALGAAFSMAILLVLFPILFTSTPNVDKNDVDLGHLQSCVDCWEHMQFVKIRGNAPGLDRIAPRTRMAARLGRIKANIRVSQLTNLGSSEAAIQDFKEWIGDTQSHDRELTLSADELGNDATLESLLTAVESDIQTVTETDVSAAAEALQYTIISARHAIAQGDQLGLLDIYSVAVSKYANLDEKTVLQDQLLKKMQKMEALPKPLDNMKIESIIDTTSRALQSIGG